MTGSGGLLRVALAALVAFSVTALVQWRRKMPVADCIHRGVVAALAVSTTWVVLELAVFEARSG